ncbi:MAG TPA: MauE/DoxX family redox-associated membrane protein [Puia sp.]|jgi:thiol-disulfide isomerase/thioredoxin
MKRSFLADSIAYLFIFLFLYTGVLKLMDIQTFRQQLSTSPLTSSLSGIIVWALPIGEILLAIALFIPKTRLKALYATAALMTFFTGYVIIVLFILDQATCSCGGIIENLSPKQHVFFNSACVILSAIAILCLRKQQPTRRFKWVTSSSAVALLVLIGWSLVTAFNAPLYETTGFEGRPIPSIPLQLADSATWLQTNDIPAGKAFIVIGFSPSCVHCQYLTLGIKKDIKDFKDIPIYYITADRFKNMMAFYRFYKLSEYPNIVMGRDSANILFRYFNKKITPLIAIFDAKKRLRRVISGEPTVMQLAQSVNN